MYTQTGEFTIIDPEKDVRSQFGQFYSFFSELSPDSPSITTVPYIDFFGLGISYH